MSNPTPIFVIGINRSGTKWLSNILCNHPDVAGIQHPDHYGILESNMLGVFQRKFDISNPDDYVALIYAWSGTDFFKLAGGERDYFLSLSPRPATISKTFGVLMDRVCERKGKKFWCQKVQPNGALLALRNFPEAKFIVIKRDAADIIRSMYVQGEALGIKRSLASIIYTYAIEERIINGAATMSGVLTISYEELKKDLDGNVAKICQWAGLEYSPDMLKIPFEKNTSFGDGKKREEAFTRGDELKMKLMLFAMRFMPPFFRRSFRAAKAFLGKDDRPVGMIIGTYNRKLKAGNNDKNKT